MGMGSCVRKGWLCLGTPPTNNLFMAFMESNFTPTSPTQPKKTGRPLKFPYPNLKKIQHKTPETQ